MRSAVPSTLRYLQDVSKEQASYWARDTRERASVSTAKYTFPQLPLPIREDWNQLELMHPWTLELAVLTASHEVKEVCASEQGHERAPLHVSINLLHGKVVETGNTTHLPARSSITSMVVPTTSYLFYAQLIRTAPCY